MTLFLNTTTYSQITQNKCISEKNVARYTLRSGLNRRCDTQPNLLDARQAVLVENGGTEKVFDI